jgi:hypothetical protein
MKCLNEGQVTSEGSCYTAKLFICEVPCKFNKKKVEFYNHKKNIGEFRMKFCPFRLSIQVLCTL